MTTDEAADRLRQLLLDAGLDPARPSPALAWEAFKRFVTELPEADTDETWFEAGDGGPAEDFPAYLDFVRLFSRWTEAGAEWGEMVTAHFASPSGVRLGLPRGLVHADDFEDLPTWFLEVEASPAFQFGAGLTGWEFEVRIDER